MTASELNSHLESDGIVQVSTYTRSVIYAKRNAGCFIEKSDGLYVRRGRKATEFLGMGGKYVSIRLGRYV